ncbi:MAG: outer membrane beta-barrel protein [Verrucomicrobiota bacterium]|jgi:hypothetical protein
MKFNKWTVGLAAIGVISLASAARADEKMSQVQTALSNTTLSGYVDVAAQWNLGSQNGGATPYYSYGPGKADGFNLNAVDIALDKPMDESPWASGYHVDLQLGPNNPYGSYPIRQAYVALRTPVGNGIDWKFGVFDSILGYESNSDPLNPNYTRSYGYTIEPTTLTGVLATYKVGDVLTLQAAVADTWSGINGRMGIESRKAYAGGITLTAPDSWGALKGGTLNAAVIHAPGSGANGGRTSLYAGTTLPTPIAALKTGLAFDYLVDHDRGVGNPSDDNAWVLGLYATIQATDKLSFNARAEYVDDADGVLYAYDYPTFANSVNHAEELTFTTQYQLWANVLSRVEFRWDHVEGGTPFDLSKVTGNPYHSNAFLLALNLIYQF